MCWSVQPGCVDQCENTALLWDSRSLRKCTHVRCWHCNRWHKCTCARCHTRSSWRHFRRKCRGLKSSEPVEGESIRGINTFQVLGSFTRTKSDSPNIASMSIGTLQPFLLLLRRSPLSVFGFMARLSTVGLMSNIPVLNVSFNRPQVIVFVSNLPASRTYRSNEDHPSTFWLYSSRFTQMSCFRADKSNANACCRPVWNSVISIEKRGFRNLRTITAETVSSHWRILSSPLMSTIVAPVRNPCTTALDSA